MRKQQSRWMNGVVWTVFVVMLGLMVGSVIAQDRLPSMPGYEQYKKMSPEIRDSVKLGSFSVIWKDDSKSFEYRRDGKTYRYDIKTRKATEVKGAVAPAAAPMGRPGGRQMSRFAGSGPRPERGRQYIAAISPDGKRKAFYRNRNFWISDSSGANEFAVTTEGNEKARIKYGTASWVYGEELNQVTAMWWSPNSKKVAYYRFDESQIKDYYLQFKQIELQDSMDIEPYTKVGAPNPVVDIYVYDLDTKNIVKVDVRDEKPFDNNVVGHYIYGISWTTDGSELLFHRTNRRQNIMELTAADPTSGKCRVIVHEEWLPSFTENTPFMQFMKDNKRFIWMSERNGFNNYYLYDLSGKLLSTLTNHQFEVANIVRVDEDAKLIYYMARDGDNPMKLQLHRVGLDGKGDVRLTDPAYNHTVNVSPDGKYFVDVAQTHDSPPFSRLMDIKGKVVDELVKSDMTKFEQLGLKKVELITFKAADGKTDLHGMLNFPSNFDPNKKYPVLVSVYGGPATNAARETFSIPSAMAEYGFLVASFDARSAGGRGKRFLDQYYGHFGIVEMDDFAEGVKSLWNRPYVNKEKVGIFGTSFGGTSSATCLLRFPDVFHAAVANSGVYDFRNYDNIYTERYMGLVPEDKAGYDAGNTLNFVNNLKGHLMIYYGTSDNNVHPSNSMQLINLLQIAKKSFEVQVGPDRGHTAVNQERMMEFFIENLVLR
ncbi:MAG: DPP IV N-terminal domain-containing protein [bacterium]